MTISDYFSEYEVNGIFKAIAAIKAGDVDWEWLINNVDSLDSEYVLSNSGDKSVAPVITRLLNTDGELEPAAVTKLANMLINRFGAVWTKLSKIYGITYNPIHNYSMTEEHSGTDVATDKPTNWKETTIDTPTNWKTTNTDRPNDWVTTSEGEDTDNGTEADSSVYGFNSTEPVPTTKDTTKTKSKNSTTQTGTFEKESEQSGTYQKDTERTGTYAKETEYGEMLERQGNIGVTTTQAMIKQEIDIWNWNFISKVFSDVDNLLTLQIYE